MKTTKIGDLVGPVSTWSPSREPTTEFTYVDLSAVDQSDKVIRDARKVLGLEAPSRARQILDEGDVLVSTVRPNLNGVALVPANLAGATASTGFCVLRPDPGRLDARYLFHWVRHPEFVAAMMRQATGASYPAVSDRIVKESLMPVPALAEQRRIAAILDAADGLRAKRRATIAALDGLTQSIFLDMFGDPLANPKSWPDQPLGRVARVMRGASPRPAGDPRYFGGSIPWLLISDVTKDPGRLLRVTRTGVTEAGRERSVFARAGTLVLSNSATIGVPKVLDIDVCIHDGFLAFGGLHPGLDREYLYSYFLALRPHLRRIAPEGTQKNLNTGIAKALRIPLPPLELQRSFATRLLLQEREKELLVASATMLDAVFASLQARAFRGDL